MSDERHQPETQMDVYSGVRWSAVAQYGSQAVQVVTSIIVARIVAPEAYGLLGMAIVVTGFLMVFQSLGFGSALIQRKEINETLTSSLFFVNIAFAALLAAGLVAAAPLCSRVYGDDRVGPIIAVLSLTFILGSLGLIPSSLLTRRLEFQRLAWVDIATSAVSAASVVALALADWGVWALVWSSVLGMAARTVFLFIVCDWRPQWIFSWSEVHGVLGFGANLTGFSIVNYFSRNADNFIIGAFLGATPLGYYSLAYRILLFPRDAVTGVLTRVLFPAFSRMQDDDARLKAAYLRACGAIAFVSFPVMVGIFVVAQPFVEVVLGEPWLPAVPLIAVLAPLGALESLLATVRQLFIAKGRADWYFRWGAGGGIVFTASFVAGLPWGVLGVAVAYALVCVPWSLLSFWLAFRLVRGLTLMDLARCVFPYFWMSSLMGASVALVETALPPSTAPRTTLGVCVGAGVIVYSLLALLHRPSALGDLYRLLPGRRFGSRRLRREPSEIVGRGE
jgi:O-antigen/teichoic acid export membrane protein